MLGNVQVFKAFRENVIRVEGHGTTNHGTVNVVAATVGRCEPPTCQNGTPVPVCRDDEHDHAGR
jgi:hypothetical protein